MNWWLILAAFLPATLRHWWRRYRYTGTHHRGLPYHHHRVGPWTNTVEWYSRETRRILRHDRTHYAW